MIRNKVFSFQTSIGAKRDKIVDQFKSKRNIGIGEKNSTK